MGASSSGEINVALTRLGVGCKKMPLHELGPLYTHNHLFFTSLLCCDTVRGPLTVARRGAVLFGLPSHQNLQSNSSLKNALASTIKYCTVIATQRG